MRDKIAVLPGDGIGPEVMRAALMVLEAVGKRFGWAFEYREALVGGAAFDEYGSHLPPETLRVCESSDAILFGSVGGPVNSDLLKWKGCEINSILALRKHFGFFANLRPVKIYNELLELSPLKQTDKLSSVDILFVRELLGDVYFGDRSRTVVSGKRTATDTGGYDEEQIASIARFAFETAGKRRSHVVSVDKANVLESSRLWREVVTEVAADYPSISLEHMLVDNCAMQLVKSPERFDVLLTSNLFGDILSDLGAALPGSLGLTPSGSINRQGFALYEPSGGSAQDIAGLGIANPTAQILSSAMMLRHSFSRATEAAAVERAVRKTFAAGVRTPDLTHGSKDCDTATFAKTVASYI